MAGEWRTGRFQTLIDDGVLEIGDGYRAKLEELGSGGPIFLRAGHVSDTHIDFTEVEHFRPERAEAVRSKMSRAGDTVITTKGNSTGRTAYVTPTMPEFVYSPHLSYWRSRDTDRLEPGFLRYWSKGPEFIGQLHGMMESTDMAPYLSLSDQRRLSITLPLIEEQREIARVLGTLDDKIELNRRMSATLEGLARAVFRSWFVDFDPVVAKAAGRRPVGMTAATAALFPDSFAETERGLIPRGWRPAKFGEIAQNVRRGVTAAEVGGSTAYIALEHMPRRSITLDQWDTAEGIMSQKFRFQKGEILFGKLRPYFHKVGVAPVAGVCSTDILVMAPRGENLFGPVLGYASSDEIIDHADGGSTGTRMPRTDWNHLSNFDIVRPTGDIELSHTRFVRPLVEKIGACVHESRTLAALRDALLPRLLSGELRLMDAERAVGSVV